MDITSTWFLNMFILWRIMVGWVKHCSHTIGFMNTWNLFQRVLEYHYHNMRCLWDLPFKGENISSHEDYVNGNKGSWHSFVNHLHGLKILTFNKSVELFTIHVYHKQNRMITIPTITRWAYLVHNLSILLHLLLFLATLLLRVGNLKVRWEPTKNKKSIQGLIRH